MKYLLIAVMLLSFKTAHSDEVIAKLVKAQTKAQKAFLNGSNRGSKFLNGTWSVVKRMCVSSLSLKAFQNPTQTFDMNNYYNVINYMGKEEIFTTTNADRAGNHCVSQAKAGLSSAAVDIMVNDISIIEVIATKTLEKKKITCSDTYKGPFLAPVFNVAKVDDHTAFFFLLPGQVAGSSSPCTNPTDFNVEVAHRIPVVE